MIFDGLEYCSVADAADIQQDEPFRLGGAGVWIGILSSGQCRLEGFARTGKSGDLLLGAAPLSLVPQGLCHLAAVRMTGQCAEELALRLETARFADGANCPNAAELVAQLAHNPRPDALPAFALLCAVATADETVRQHSPLVDAALEEIRTNYMMLSGVEELAEQLGVSKNHLVRCFSEEIGTPPGKYLTKTRIEAVKILLREQDLNLEAVAGLCGFSGANYLCRVFKKETGFSPLAWRESVSRKIFPRRSRSDEIYV